MRIVLVGADFEENLGMAMIAAVSRERGHAVEIVPFDDASQLGDVADAVIAREPQVIGLSIQFQHRSNDFLALARRLRACGYRGHITCGGQFPTLAYREVLGHPHGVDSVVLHDGEHTFVELLDGLRARRRLGEIAGLAMRADDGAVMRTAPRALPHELDELPFPHRYRAHTRHMGVPFIPIMGSRGCWGACSFCSITTYYRDARAYGGGKMLRHRSPENIAAEMALLSHGVGGSAVFCFHDDTFLLPQPDASLQRVRAIRTALDSYGVGRVGMIGKCRPDSMTPELARDLAALGVIRLYVGVENVSEQGAAHLNRSRQTRQVRTALQACREAGIFGCYNLLLFEPDATLQDIEDNAAFIREHASHPVNFCRAEPYFGTPLQRDLSARGTLGGSYLGFDYRIADDRTELLFRICATAFRQRNFAPQGVHNRYMGLGYNAKLLEYFYPEDRSGGRLELLAEATRLTRGIALESADFLEEATALARSVDLRDRDRIERRTALLALRIAEADRYQHIQLDELYRAMARFAASSQAPAPVRRPASVLLRTAKRVAHGMALATLLSAWTAPLQGCDDRSVAADAGEDGRTNWPDGVVDMLPPDAGTDVQVSDPLPPDAALDGMVVDMLPPDSGVDAMVADPPPADQGVLPDFILVDPAPPPDSMVVDMLPPDSGVDAASASPGGNGASEPQSLDTSSLIDKWRDTSPRRAVRSNDLPLYEPPDCRLVASSADGVYHVRLAGGPDAISTRWESDGAIEGEGREVRWIPESSNDQLRVGIRSKGGVTVLAIRASDVS